MIRWVLGGYIGSVGEYDSFLLSVTWVLGGYCWGITGVLHKVLSAKHLTFGVLANSRKIL